MAEPALSTIPRVESKPQGLLISGRILRARRHEKVHYTQLILPSVDEYQGPAYVEVRSKASLGAVEEDVSVRVQVGGYRRKSYNFVDRDTGESRQVHPVENVLTVIE